MFSDKRFKMYKIIGIQVAISILVSWGGFASADEVDHSQHSGDEHAQHRAMMTQDGYKRKQVSYQLPKATLIDQNGEKVSTAELFDGSDPVMLNFIFTSCTTICPVLAATFAQVQRKFAPELNDVKMISISIDPEHDTPAKLKEYGQRFNAAENWTFVTGDLGPILEVLSAFDAYRGDKMNHIPLILMRRSAAAPWLRLEGFPGANDLLKEYRSLASQKVSSQ